MRSNRKSYRLGDILKEISMPIKMDDNKIYNLASIKRRNGGFFDRERKKGKDILTKTLSKVIPGSFVISKMQVVHGACAMAPLDIGEKYISASYVSFLPRNEQIIDIGYLEAYSHTRKSYDSFFRSSQGIHIEKMTFKVNDWLKEKIELPPLIEQKKIAKILNSFDNLIHLFTQEICKSELLLKGLTIQLTSKNNDTKNTIDSTIGEEVDFQGGSQPPRSSFKFKPEENLVRLLQIRDYKSDKNATYIPKELSKRWCSKKNVMIGRYGPPNFQILRGKEGSFNVALIKATAKSERRLNNEYLYRVLSRHDLFEIIDKLSQRTSGQQGVDMDALKSFSFPLKTLDNQLKIAQILQEFEDYKNHLIAKKEKYILLKNALSNDLISGNKIVNV